MAKADTKDAIVIASAPPRDDARLKPIIAKLLRNVAWRITALLAGIGVARIQAHRPATNNKPITPKQYSTISQGTPDKSERL